VSAAPPGFSGAPQEVSVALGFCASPDEHRSFAIDGLSSRFMSMDKLPVSFSSERSSHFANFGLATLLRVPAPLIE